MLKIKDCLFICLLINIPWIQASAQDSTYMLKEVVIKSYLSEEKMITAPVSLSVLDSEELDRQEDHSFVAALNTIPGIRAEERSPGSYRLSLRGSLLRSPFGVRNVKIYYDEIPFTDAGGNSYLNTLNINAVRNIEVLKGPDGSLFGANSGGVVRLSPFGQHQEGEHALKAGLNLGSYGLFHQQASVHKSWENNELYIDQSYLKYDGYRENSKMNKKFLQIANKWTITDKSELKITGIYSDLFYQTPGGLTADQLLQNPRAARYATSFFPSAIEQQISIRTKLFLLGLSQEWAISDRIKNVTTIFGNHVDFANPFITNYEERKEYTFGGRSYFEYKNHSQKDISWKLNLGLEWQQTNAQIGNYGNVKGVKDTAQSMDDIHTNQHFIFTRFSVDFFKKLHVEAAVSINYYAYAFRNNYPLFQDELQKRNFTPQIMPRLALSYQFNNHLVWRASISRGYSTPTIAEIRPTDNQINTDLRAEYGWNYETGLRFQNEKASLFLDASFFYYKLHHAIVRRLHPDETEYYINAGGTHQPGFEFLMKWWPMERNNHQFIRGIRIDESFSFQKFTFGDYLVEGNEYSGNKLTGVPAQVLVSGLQFYFRKDISLFIQHNYTSSIPLNDANTVFSDSYHLLQMRLSWTNEFNSGIQYELFGSANNLLNEHYSLGNDLNAVGQRYFNPSPLRNYTIGFKILLK